MSKNYTITISAAQDKALSFVTVSQQEWIQNAVNARCQDAIEEIVNAEVQRKLAAGQPISGTKEEIVLAANIKTAAQVQEEYEASRLAQG
jgi:hypothetical protein